MEYTVVLRLAEQFLIRGRGENSTRKCGRGIEDLNVLRDRATDKSVPLDQRLQQLSPGLSTEEALIAVDRENRVELFTEWGNRWFGLKRTQQIDNVMTAYTIEKGGTWSSFQSIYPIPLIDIQRNPNLTQNEGYN